LKSFNRTGTIEMPLDEIQKRFCQELKKVYEARYARGWGSVGRFAELIGVSAGQVSNILAAEPRRCGDEIWRREVARRIGVPYEILIGKEPRPQSAVPKTSPGERRKIPIYETWRLSAGVNGVSFDPYEEADKHLLMPATELGSRAQHDLRAVRVGGASMEPLIPEGSVVVLDLADRDFVDGRIYAVAVDEGGVEMVATVKRVRRMDGAFVLWPENSAYSPQIARGDWPDICVGRVVWLWRSLERA
jgi:hypothetical protein